MTTPLWRQIRATTDELPLYTMESKRMAVMFRLISSRIKPPLSRAAIKEWLEAEAARAEAGE